MLSVAQLLQASACADQSPSQHGLKPCHVYPSPACEGDDVSVTEAPRLVDAHLGRQEAKGLGKKEDHRCLDGLDNRLRWAPRHWHNSWHFVSDFQAGWSSAFSGIQKVFQLVRDLLDTPHLQLQKAARRGQRRLCTVQTMPRGFRRSTMSVTWALLPPWRDLVMAGLGQRCTAV